MTAAALRLFVKSPGAEERVYDVSAPGVEIGRDPDAEVPVADRTLSRRHCRLYVGQDGWRVTDLGSRNGTFLNGSLILDERIAAGDQVELGETRIAVFTPGTGEDAEATQALEALVEEAKAKRSSRHGQEGRREIRALTRLMELNEKINALKDEDRLLEGVLDAAIELTYASRAFLLLKQEDHFIVRRARLPHRRDLDDAQASLSVSVATRVIQEGRSILAENAITDDRFDEFASIANLQLRSLLCVPMRSREEVLGALYLDNPSESGTFDGWDVRILESFAVLASIALRNARQRREMAARRREAVRQARRIERLNERLKRALRIRTNALREARAELAKQADEFGLKYTYDQIVGRGPAMQRVLGLCDRVTDLKIPVLIVGESGTGKELLARAIHFNGPRRRARLVSENCAAIPETLMESEFFGYERGAFTGAQRRALGPLRAVASGDALPRRGRGDVDGPPEEVPPGARGGRGAPARRKGAVARRLPPGLGHEPRPRGPPRDRRVSGGPLLPDRGRHRRDPPAPRAQGGRAGAGGVLPARVRGRADGRCASIRPPWSSSSPTSGRATCGS